LEIILKNPPPLKMLILIDERFLIIEGNLHSAFGSNNLQTELSSAHLLFKGDPSVITPGAGMKDFSICSIRVFQDLGFHHYLSIHPVDLQNRRRIIVVLPYQISLCI